MIFLIEFQINDFLNEIFFLIDFEWCFFYTISNKAPLHIAIEKGNLDVVQTLLSNPNIDVNCESVFIIILF